MNSLDWKSLAAYLRLRSAQICADNQCTPEEHRCESYAYIRHDGVLLDVCASDFFQGAIPLPWSGTGEELKQAVENDCEDYEN